jgi:uncharacterized protein YndB with AHSA1/START domain
MQTKTINESIHVAVQLPMPAEKAWALLTEQHHIVNWWGDHVGLQAEAGGKFRETWLQDGREIITSGEVIFCEPPRALEMSWADGAWPGYTKVAFCLSQHGEGTRLTLDHSGWDVQPKGERQALMDARAE